MMFRSHPFTGPAPWRPAAAGVACLACLVAGTARAVPNCDSLPNVVYGSGGSAETPLVGAVAAKLAALATPITVVYAAPGACTGLNDFLNGSYSGTATYWSTAGTSSTCQADPAEGGVIIPDFAVTGVYASSCAGVTLPSSIEDVAPTAGPVLAWDFIVPSTFTQGSSLSTQAAYFIWGFGAASGDQVPPWTNTAEIFSRSSTSAAQVAVGAAIGIPPGAFKGTGESSNSVVVAAVAGTSSGDSLGIGFVSSDVADASRSSVSVLAYQHVDQTCGYWPDSNATAHDKSNVRDGQYFLWSESHFFVAVNSDGSFATTANGTSGATVQQVIDSFLTGTTNSPLSATDVLNATISTGNIPECAMSVWRDSDLGTLYSFEPAQPCDCYFESQATGSTSCEACSDSSTCPGNAPVCRYGFCEVQ